MDRYVASGAAAERARSRAGFRTLGLTVLVLSAACDPGVFDKYARGEDSSSPDAEIDESLDAEIAPGGRDASEDEDAARDDAADQPPSGQRGTLDAGLDASTSRADAQTMPAPEDARAPDLDECGQAHPVQPSLFSIFDRSVSFAPVPQHPSLDPRAANGVTRYNDRLLWIFGTAYLSNLQTLGASSSYATSSVDRPYQISEAEAGVAVRAGLIPDLAADSALLMEGEQLGYGTGNVIRSGDKGLLFYEVNAVVGFGKRLLGTRVAELSFDGSVARAVPAAELVFAPGKSYLWGLNVDEQVYLYACPMQPDSYFVCFVARAPFATATSNAAFEYWTANGWSKDAAAAAPVLTEAKGEISVSYNPYLRRYLAVHLVWITSEIRLLSAERPQGPWTSFASIATPPGEETWRWTAVEHPELSRDCGRQLELTYLQTFVGGTHELRRIEVRLR